MSEPANQAVCSEEKSFAFEVDEHVIMLSDCPGLMQTHLLLPTKIIIAQTMTVASYYLET